MLDFTDIKMGKVVIINNVPHVITKCDFLKMQMAKPTKKCKLKNLVNGTNLEHTFKSGGGAEEADLRKDKCSFLYSNNGLFTFMNSDTFETMDIDKELLGGKEIYLKEGEEVTIVYFNDNPITVEIPIKVSLKIVETAVAVKGNSVTDIQKDAKAENGTILRVPAFIKEGDYVLYNTVEEEYAGRDTSEK